MKLKYFLLLNLVFHKSLGLIIIIKYAVFRENTKSFVQTLKMLALLITT